MSGEIHAVAKHTGSYRFIELFNKTATQNKFDNSMTENPLTVAVHTSNLDKVQ